MLSFFRRIVNSRIGVIVTFVVLGMIAVAFGLGDVTGMLKGSGTAVGDNVATVGGAAIGSTELRQRVQTELQGIQQQNPDVTMAQFVEQGGFDGTLDRIINGLAFEAFGHGQGMIVSKKTIDGQIASIPALHGVDGKFDQKILDRLLAEQHLTYPQISQDIARDTLAQQIVAANAGATQVPAGVALPYASLLLEKRAGSVGFVPAQAMAAGPPPTDAEIVDFYRRNLALYTVPERRVIRYAILGPDFVKAETTPSDAEIAAAYQAHRDAFQPVEKRVLMQVVAGDAATANTLAAKVKGGTPIEAAAHAAGLEAGSIPGIAKAAYAAQNSPALADAVFAAAKGAVVGPVRMALGYAIVRVADVQQIAGKSLEQAKPDLIKALSANKTNEMLNKLHDTLDDSISDHATFDELAGKQKLAAVTTPPLLAAGTDPDNAAMKPDPKLAQVIAAAFAAQPGDDPQLVPVGQDSFAVVSLGKVVPAAPRPLAQIRVGVARDVAIDRAGKAARKIAGDIVAAVNKGAPLAQALAATKLPLPPPQPLAASRAQLAAAQQRVPAALALMFSMAPKNAKLLEAPNRAGWLIVYLATIDRGDAGTRPGVIAATQTDLAKSVGREYVEQLTEAVRRAVGVKKNDAEIARVKAALTSGGTSDQQ